MSQGAAAAQGPAAGQASASAPDASFELPAGPALISPRARAAVVARHGQIGSDWLEQLPARVRMLCYRWKLQLGSPLTGGAMSAVLGAVDSAGRDVVLKLHPRGEDTGLEATTLRAWQQTGRYLGFPGASVPVLDYSLDDHAMLLGRLRPGEQLRKAPRLDAKAEAARMQPALRVILATSARDTAELFGGVGALLPAGERIAFCLRRRVEEAHAFESTGEAGSAITLLPAFVRRSDDALADWVGAALDCSQEEPAGSVLHGDLICNNVISHEPEGATASWTLLDPMAARGPVSHDIAMLAVSLTAVDPAAGPERALDLARAYAQSIDLAPAGSLALIPVYAAERLLLHDKYGYHPKRNLVLAALAGMPLAEVLSAGR